MGGMKHLKNLLKRIISSDFYWQQEVEGLRTKGTGFLIEADGVIKEGEDFELMSSKFIWMRAV